jgi:hypothetical protein
VAALLISYSAQQVGQAQEVKKAIDAGELQPEGSAGPL